MGGAAGGGVYSVVIAFDALEWDLILTDSIVVVPAGAGPEEAGVCRPAAPPPEPAVP